MNDNDRGSAVQGIMVIIAGAFGLTIAFIATLFLTWLTLAIYGWTIIKWFDMPTMSFWQMFAIVLIVTIFYSISLAIAKFISGAISEY